ncbi:peptidoglycan recognition protein family protein [Anaerovorax odorimutans]|uniref:peptidoglycan recognition protein family protein n=1 Tax=Anaerovorax odorimutans TaxID=109327 RepID=UPI0003F64D6E|nr:N-acetylmuramoyl-L-alanine amidase [Anaerovorax odorimutans]
MSIEEFRINRKRRRIRNLIVFLIIVSSLTIGIVIAVKEAAPSKERLPVSNIDGIPVVTDLLPKGIEGRPGVTRKIKYIVIHETGNTETNADAVAHDIYLHRVAEEKPLAWHYTVDDHEIYQHLPDNEIGYHAGDQLKKDGGNVNGIGIEMCVNSENDYEQTLKNTALLVHYLLDVYDLDISAVKKHQDFSGKICPERLIKEDRWDEFLEMISSAEEYN